MIDRKVYDRYEVEGGIERYRMDRNVMKGIVFIGRYRMYWKLQDGQECTGRYSMYWKVQDGYE